MWPEQLKEAGLEGEGQDQQFSLGCLLDIQTEISQKFIDDRVSVALRERLGWR